MNHLPLNLGRGPAALRNKPRRRTKLSPFVEEGNLIVINQRRLAGTHVVRLYQRIKRAKDHQKAVVAVARHLAEAAWWVLAKQEVYREPRNARPGSFVDARVSAVIYLAQRG